jgi:hypothetical protein
MATYKKLTINMTEDVYATLTDLAGQRGITITELIKRSVALHKFVWEHRDGELLLREGDTMTKIVMI